MTLAIFLFILVVVLIISAWKHVRDEKVVKAFTAASFELLLAMFLSTIISVAIALEADIPDSSGHGGFIYIIIPAISGIGFLTLYLISLLAIPSQKFLLGVLGVILNICVGIIVLNTDY